MASISKRVKTTATTNPSAELITIAALSAGVMVSSACWSFPHNLRIEGPALRPHNKSRTLSTSQNNRKAAAQMRPASATWDVTDFWKLLAMAHIAPSIAANIVAIANDLANLDKFLPPGVTKARTKKTRTFKQANTPTAVHHFPNTLPLTLTGAGKRLPSKTAFNTSTINVPIVTDATSSSASATTSCQSKPCTFGAPPPPPQPMHPARDDSAAGLGAAHGFTGFSLYFLFRRPLEATVNNKNTAKARRTTSTPTVAFCATLSSVIAENWGARCCNVWSNKKKKAVQLSTATACAAKPLTSARRVLRSCSFQPKRFKLKKAATKMVPLMINLTTARFTPSWLKRVGTRVS
mmetsp:Transcript_131161/g.379408  ORF Transcript_131161/g.379408 Transcript_131161/m.379408 type:complete len:350 (-) Transcript_131161:682-1731(-)